MARTMDAEPRDYIQCIYALSGPDGKIRYIGKASYARQALSSLRTAIRKNSYPDSPVHIWGKEIGVENIGIKIIEKIQSFDQALGFERRNEFIELFMENTDPNLPLLNIYSGKSERAEQARNHKRKNNN